MRIIVNGKPRQVPDQVTLQGLVENPNGVALALNGRVVRAADWPGAVLHEDDAVEIVTARQGG